MNKQKETEIYEIFSKLNRTEDVELFFTELFTQSEINDFLKRWDILKMLNDKKSQRTIAKELSVSLCNITRGAKILKNENSIARKILFDESWRN